MKKSIRILVISVFLMAIPLFMVAQTPPSPNGGSTPGSGNTPVGGGAPIGGGMLVLLGLGLAYGGKKVYDFKKADIK